MTGLQYSLTLYLIYMVESQNGFVNTRLIIGDNYELARMFQFCISTEPSGLHHQQQHRHLTSSPSRAPESDADIVRQEHRPDDPLFPIAEEHSRDFDDDDDGDCDDDDADNVQFNGLVIAEHWIAIDDEST